MCSSFAAGEIQLHNTTKVHKKEIRKRTFKENVFGPFRLCARMLKTDHI